MKACIFVFIAFVLPTYITSGNINWQIENSFSDFDVVSSVYGDVIIYSGNSVMPTGHPDLPGETMRFSLPSGAHVISAVLEDQEWSVLGNYDILPRQPDVPLSLNPSFVGPSSVVYEENSFYPENPVLSFSTGSKSGFQIAGVVYTPFRYNPVTKELQFLKKATLVVEYAEGMSSPVFLTQGQIEVFSQDVEGLVINNQDVCFNTPLVKEARDGEVEYVIVAPEELVQSFEPLIRWKNQKGIPSKIFSLEWISSHYQGNDDMEKIRNFVKDYHQNHGLIYLVLAGDNDNLGARFIHSEVAFFQISTDMPSDLYFSDVVPYDKNWDANGNHVYGEFIQDSCDWYSDVYVGRFPVNSTTEAENWITKLLTYEQTPSMGYLEKSLQGGAGLWPDSNIFGSLICDTIAENCLPLHWSHTKLYENHSGHPDGFLDSLNNGYHWVHVAAHGNQDGVYWYGYPSQMLVSSMISSLSNGMKLFVFHSCACMPGWFDNYECLAEYIFNAPNGGSIALMLNARYGIGDGILPGLPVEGNGMGPSDWLNIWTARKVFRDSLYNIGRGHGVGKDNCIPIMDSSYHWCINELNLLGDPETQIYFSEPDTITALHEDSIQLGNHQFSVNVQTGGLPLEGAVCCITGLTDSSVFARAFTDASGNATIDYNISSADDMCLTVYAHDCIYYQDTLCVYSQSAFVTIVDFDTITGGLDNGQINSGFTYSAYPSVVNHGQNTANGVKAVLVSLDSSATVGMDTVEFGSINPHDTASSSSGFSVTFHDSIPDLYVVPFTFTCWDQNDSVWESTISLTVNGSELVLISAMGPELIEPGDDFSMSFKICNTGSGSISSLEINLLCADPYITLIDSFEQSNLINPFDTLTLDSAFTVHVSESIPTPSFVEMNLLGHSHGGYHYEGSGSIGIGGVLFNDGFENGDSLWTFQGPASWHITEHRNHSSSHSMYCGNEGTWQYSSQIVNSRVVFDSFTSSERTLLTFWHWYEIFNNSDKVQLQASTDGGSTWSLLYPQEGYTGTWLHSPYDSIYTGDHRVWQKQNVYFNYEGSILLSWLFFSGPSGVAEGYYFDDVSIVIPSGLVNVEEQETGHPLNDRHHFSLSPVYPNPVRGRTVIGYSVGSEVPVRLAVYDISGRQ
ncbi:hypothetical protein JXA84_01265, partial [candidate division WOR-3 bacterium]|nr:hypothetical protein [candidate division WOR-3 bacterium]